MKADRHVLVAVRDAELMSLLREAAKAAGGLRLETAASGKLADLQEAALAAAAMVVEINPTVDGAVEDFHRLARTLPERRIIAAAVGASGEDVRRLFRAGAADVLTEPFTVQGLCASLTEVLRAQGAGPAASGRVISVIKACGGAGATTLALNLAASLAQGDPKRRRAARSTAVLDFDLQFGDSDVLLDLQPKSGIVDALRAPERVDLRFLQSVMTEHASGLKLLAPASGVLPMDAMSADLAANLVDLTSASYDRVIVDLPSAWTDWSLQVLAQSDLIVLVSVPTVAGALRARRVLQALNEAQVSQPVFFVLNRLNGIVEAFDRPGRIGKSLEISIDASLPLDPAAAKAEDKGKLVTEAFPSSRLAKDLRLAAGRLDERLEALQAATGVAEPVA